MTTEGTDDATTRSSRTPLIVAALLSAALLLLGGIVAGRLTAPTMPAPSTTSAEAGFARDMQTHHHQAVQLSLIIRDTSENQTIRSLAYDIATSQGQQAGQMYGWLTVWGLPHAAPEPAMTWMTRPTLDGGTAHEHGSAGMTHEPGSPMPGLATREQIAALEGATGAPADRQFLELMIAHHTGGVEMATALLERSDNRVATSLARGIVTAQSSEIEYMRGLLSAL